MTPHTPKTHTPTAHHYPLNTHMHTTRHMFTHKNILVPDHNMHIYTTAMTHTHTHTHTHMQQTKNTEDIWTEHHQQLTAHSEHLDNENMTHSGYKTNTTAQLETWTHFYNS